MARVAQADVQAWVEGTKFTIPTIATAPYSDLLGQIEEEIVARLGSVYDISGWTNNTNTPYLVRVAIAKKFVAWAYRRLYSESMTDQDAKYAELIEANSESIISGLVDGTITIPGVVEDNVSAPAFYPTDQSSMMCPTDDDPSLGPAKFSMGQVF